MFDKAIFLSQKAADKNSDLATQYFQLNKKLDNFVNWLTVDLVMDKLGTALHHKWAHKAPLTADEFSDFNAIYSYRTKYPTVYGEEKQYQNIIEGIVDILDYLSEIDNSLSEAMEIAAEDENKDYERFLSDEFLTLREYKKEFVLLHDKVENYIKLGNTLQDIDNRYEDFLIEG